MKLYSWNVKFNNRKMPEAYEFIQGLDFDVLCLQEVTPDLLAKLKTINAELVATTDSRDIRKDTIYNVILSRLPITNSDDFEIPFLPFPFRTRLFIRLMHFYGWSPLLEKRALFIDVVCDDTQCRIFSVHNTIFGPRSRFREFDAVLQKIDTNMRTLIAGDLNIIQSHWLKILNWLLGAPFIEATPLYSERSIVEKIFAEYELLNPLRGQITHKFSHSQLDHILISKDIELEDVGVEKNSHGSDHQPIFVSVKL